MELKAAVISLESVSSNWVVKAMKKYFTSVDDLNIKDIDVILCADKPEILHKGKPLKDYHCIYAKGSFRYAALLKAIVVLAGEKAYVPIKKDTSTIVNDKLLTQLRLEQSNLPMPKTYLAATAEAAKKILSEINYPIVMKFPQGTHGKGVMFAESYPAAASMLDALTALKQPFLIQEYIETEGSDIRAIVVGDKIVASMRRTAGEGEKRANIHSGGKGESILLDSHSRKLALEASKAVGADICGVDILESVKGPLIIELNISPGLQGITSVTGVDVADKIAKYLYEQTTEFVKKQKKIESESIMKEMAIKGVAKEIITNLDFRGERILLPEAVVKESGLNEKDEVTIRVDKKKIVVEKMRIGEDKK